jgi:hypothetical protein
VVVRQILTRSSRQRIGGLPDEQFILSPVLQAAPNATLQDASNGNDPVVGISFSSDMTLQGFTCGSSKHRTFRRPGFFYQ